MGYTEEEMTRSFKIPAIKSHRELGLTLRRFGFKSLYEDSWTQVHGNNQNTRSIFGLKESKEYVERLIGMWKMPYQVSCEKVLLIDDMRNLEADVICRNYADGMNALLYDGPWKTLLLDHDLASYDEKTGKEQTGYNIICWLEEFPRFAPKEIICVSDNPVSRRKIEIAIQNIYKRRKRG